MRTVVPTTDYRSYVSAWDKVTRSGYRNWNVDTWAYGRRYVSLAALALTHTQLTQLRTVTNTFSRLIDRAVDGILADPDWWSALAWPWPAVELARQEPRNPAGPASLFGRFDCLLDLNGEWRVIEYNADTPSGGRETSGLEPAIARLHPGLQRINSRLSSRVAKTLARRIGAQTRPLRSVGVVSTHGWIEDIAQANWLAALLVRAGLPASVGDVTDLGLRRGHITLRGKPIDALYRFYP